MHGVGMEQSRGWFPPLALARGQLSPLPINTPRTKYSTKMSRNVHRRLAAVWWLGFFDAVCTRKSFVYMDAVTMHINITW